MRSELIFDEIIDQRDQQFSVTHSFHDSVGFLIKIKIFFS